MVRDIRAGVMDLIVELEARLDFEEDLGPVDAQQLQQQVAELQEEIEEALRTAKQGTLLRNGLQVGRRALWSSSALGKGATGFWGS